MSGTRNLSSGYCFHDSSLGYLVVVLPSLLCPVFLELQCKGYLPFFDAWTFQIPAAAASVKYEKVNVNRSRLDRKRAR